jgi:hypothetical protein
MTWRFLHAVSASSSIVAQCLKVGKLARDGGVRFDFPGGTILFSSREPAPLEEITIIRSPPRFSCSSSPLPAVVVFVVFVFSSPCQRNDRLPVLSMLPLDQRSWRMISSSWFVSFLQGRIDTDSIPYVGSMLGNIIARHTSKMIGGITRRLSARYPGIYLGILIPT